MKKILQQENGVALIMVLTVIVILTALWGDFTFESKISRLKTTNVLDKSQAKLLAESGLELAINRLRLYKEALNTWENNQNAKQSVSIQLINQLWEVPFMYPIPVPANAGVPVRESIKEFQKESLLEGEFNVSIQNISNKINLNLLRVDLLKDIPQAPAPGQAPPPPPDPSLDPPAPPQTDPLFSVEQQLVDYLNMKFMEKREKDEDFENRIGGLEVNQLVANLKFYLSDRGVLRQNNGTSPIDSLMIEAEQAFSEAKVTPKHAPFSSLSELYLIPGWNDEIINMVKDDFGVFPSVTIDLNKINEPLLRLLIPNLDVDDVRSFFEYRDNPENPRFFNTLTDFENYIVKIANLMTDAAFKERFDKFKAQGIEFSSAPTLFRIISTGKFNRAEYTIVATVSIPKQSSTNTQQPGTPSTGQPPAGAPAGTPAGAPGQTTQLLIEPRIIEIQIN